ncbi:hypothetical protein EDC04DRAFT_800641 [Pisolithus marmoratus]|nr:hypothetical protein EDC04DRAFT_800641 [Pisolithus marmoratus]
MPSRAEHFMLGLSVSTFSWMHFRCHPTENMEAVCGGANIFDLISKDISHFMQTFCSLAALTLKLVGSLFTAFNRSRATSFCRLALLNNPMVLLLGEATSTKVVKEALARAAKGRTMIAIAHRLTTQTACSHCCIVTLSRMAVSAKLAPMTKRLVLRGDWNETCSAAAVG